MSAPFGNPSAKPWTGGEMRELLRQRRGGESFRVIGVALGRGATACADKCYKLDGGADRHNERAAQALIAERDARATASRSLTAAICGDPPSGYSALDRRPAQRRAITLAARA